MRILTPSSDLSTLFAGLAIGTEPSILENILLVGAKDTPMLREIKRVPVSNVKSVWLHDTLRAPRKASDSAAMYVQDFDANTSNTSVENENVVQIFRDDVSVAKILQNIASIDKQAEFERQLSKRSIEHLLDIENAFWGDQSPFLSSADTEKNIVGGVWHFAKNQATDYEGKELIFDDILDIQQKVYDSGGDPRKIFVGAGMKRKINDIVEKKKVTRFLNGDSRKVDFLISTIETDFGATDIVLTRFLKDMPDRILCCDPESIELGLLQDTTVIKPEGDNLANNAIIYSGMTYHFRNTFALSAGVGFKV